MSKYAVAALFACASELSAADLDTSTIDAITGLKGKLTTEDGVYKISQPRTDIKIAVDGWHMPPFYGADIVGRLSGRQGRQCHGNG